MAHGVMRSLGGLALAGLLLLAGCNPAPSEEAAKESETPAAGATPLAVSAEGVGVGVAACPRAGAVFRDCEDCPELVIVPGGTFQMAGGGAPDAAAGAQQGPSVTLASFAIGVFETTFDEWAACAAGGGCQRTPKPDDRKFGRGRKPVFNVAWLDAKEYAAWLTEKSGGKVYRLPTDAEWEYAARGGQMGPLASIAAWPGRYLEPGAERAGPRVAGGPQEVGGLQANPFGLQDVHGNLWEWVEDCYAPTPNPGPAGEASQAGDCSYRVQRGGAWNRSVDAVWERGGNRLLYRDYDAGIRLLRELRPEDCMAAAAPPEPSLAPPG